MAVFLLRRLLLNRRFRLGTYTVMLSSKASLVYTVDRAKVIPLWAKKGCSLICDRFRKSLVTNRSRV